MFPLRIEFSSGYGANSRGVKSSVPRHLAVAARLDADKSCRCRYQVAHADQVVGRQCQGEHPINQGEPAMAGLPQPADSFDPTEDFLHPFAFALTSLVARVAGSALVDDAGGLTSEMRGDPMLAHFQHQLFAIIALVGAQGDALPAWDLFDHRQRRFWLGVASGLGGTALHRHPITILHQYVADVAE